MKKVLIVAGGWDGHTPRESCEYCRDLLIAEGYQVDLSFTLEAFSEEAKLREYDLIVPHWTMGKIEHAWVENVSRVVEDGCGLAGWHGGMCDAFRENTIWQFMTGGQFVEHPGGSQSCYKLRYKTSSSPIVEGLSDFSITTEQYYMHVDPANEVLAVVDFPNAFGGPYSSNGATEMPAAWTRRWGKGRVFYTSLGHVCEDLMLSDVTELLRRGMLWATR